jgi:hypothetical protein
MLFRIIAAVASVALIAQGALAQMTPDQVVFNIGVVTTASGNAANTLSLITTDTGLVDIETAGQVSRGQLARVEY